jgi:UDP-N-acetylmuramate-alanine ligase
MSLLRDFATAFDDADHVAILPTYRPAGRERHEEDPSVPALVSEMTHPDCHALSEEAAAWWIAEGAQSGDTALIMGAGDVWTIEPRILALLAERR